MTKLKVIKPFQWAHRHVDVKSYEKGDVIETDDQDLIDVSVSEGWAKKDGKPEADQSAAPENKAQAQAPQTA